MVGISTSLRYLSAKFEFSVAVSRQAYLKGKLNKVPEVFDVIWNNIRNERLTFMHWSKAKEMDNILGLKGATLLVRKIPELNSETLQIGDVVVHKDPGNSGNILVRRIIALEGHMMSSTDESFVLAKNQCWVVADNENMEELYDSREFGPLHMPHIIGRPIYSLRSAVDHGPIQNSPISKIRDSAVLEVELDIDLMTAYHRE